jgi:hypothetical protein
MSRWAAAAVSTFVVATSLAWAQGAQPPIRIGSTLALTGPLGVDLTATFTNVTKGFVVQFRGLIAGRAASNSWDNARSVSTDGHRRSIANPVWAARLATPQAV